MNFNSDMLFGVISLLYFLPMIAIAILVPVLLIRKVKEANPDRETLLKEYPFLKIGNKERRIRFVQVCALVVLAISLISTGVLAFVLDIDDFNQIPIPLMISFIIMIAGAAVFAVTTMIANMIQRVRYMKYGYYDI